MIQVSFISEQKLKDLVPISSNNTITAPLKQSMWDAQEMYIKPILCQPLYDEIANQIVNNTVTPANQTLLDVIAPCLAYYTLYKYLPYSWAKIREMGVVNQTGTTAVTISLNDLTFMRSEAESSAKMYEIRLVNFLENNKSTYPLYKCDCDCNLNNCETAKIRLNDLFDYI